MKMILSPQLSSPGSTKMALASLVLSFWVTSVSSQTCTSSTSRCQVSGNKATCGAQAGDFVSQLSEFTLNNCGDINCNSKFSCAKANIRDVPAGGHIDCNSRSAGSHESSCESAKIFSKKPFTLTCRSEAGDPLNSYQGNECKMTSVTNPGGSVFCFGGTIPEANCNQMRITDSVGCVICGGTSACSRVQVVDSSGVVKETTPWGQVWMQPRCTAAHVLDYLNKFHSTSSESLYSVDNPYEDLNNNKIPDVVEEFCALDKNKKDANCIQEFQQSWTKTVISSSAATDPDSLVTSSGNNDSSDDSTSMESWVVGAIVIGLFVLAMLLAVWYLGSKNQWSLWNKCCGKQHQEDSSKGTSELLQKWASLGPDGQSKAIKDIDAILQEQQESGVSTTSTEQEHTENV